MRARLEKPWFFKFRIKACGGGEMKNGVAEEVVPLGTITAARTYQAMVAELVQNAVAHVAYAIRIEQRNPEPPKNRCPKQEGDRHFSAEKAKDIHGAKLLREELQ